MTLKKNTLFIILTVVLILLFINTAYSQNQFNNINQVKQIIVGNWMWDEPIFSDGVMNVEGYETYNFIIEESGNFTILNNENENIEKSGIWRIEKAGRNNFLLILEYGDTIEFYNIRSDFGGSIELSLIRIVENGDERIESRPNIFLYKAGEDIINNDDHIIEKDVIGKWLWSIPVFAEGVMKVEKYIDNTLILKKNHTYILYDENDEISTRGDWSIVENNVLIFKNQPVENKFYEEFYYIVYIDKNQMELSFIKSVSNGQDIISAYPNTFLSKISEGENNNNNEQKDIKLNIDKFFIGKWFWIESYYEETNENILVFDSDSIFHVYDEYGENEITSGNWGIYKEKNTTILVLSFHLDGSLYKAYFETEKINEDEIEMYLFKQIIDNEEIPIEDDVDETKIMLKRSED